MENIFAYIDEHFDRFKKNCGPFAANPAFSARNIGLRELRRIVAGKFESLGMDVQLWETRALRLFSLG